MFAEGSPSSGIPLTEALILQKSRLDSLAAVKNLNLWGCEINDVSYLRNVPNIEIITLSINNLSTLRDFAGCPNLKEIYMRKNEVAALSEVQYLGSLKNLRTLWLCDNPCASSPLYRLFTIRTCPGLAQLDDKPVSDEERDQARRMSASQVNECLVGGNSGGGGNVGGGGGGGAPLGNANGANSNRPLHQAPSTSSVNIPAQQQQQQRQQRAIVSSSSVSPPMQQQQQAPPSSSSSSRSAQKAMVSAILTLMDELSPESLDFIRKQAEQKLLTLRK